MFKEFVNIVESDLRRVSGQSFLFEEINQDYKEQMIQIFKKALKDEMEAVIFYKFQSEKYYKNEIDEILRDISQEEFQHFNELVSYASSHGILEFLNDYKVELLPLTNITQDVLKLETEAINDYKNASEVANAVGDTETRMFFEELMKDETIHYDKIAKIAEITREFDS